MSHTEPPLSPWQTLLFDMHHARWGRWLPTQRIESTLIRSSAAGVTRQEIEEDLRLLKCSLTDECWIPPEPFTEEDLADDDLDDGSCPEPPPGTPRPTADQLNADEQAHHEELVARIDELAAEHGLGRVRTNGDVIDLMLALGLLRQDDGKLFPAQGVPMPEEVIPMTPEEQERERSWRRLDRISTLAHKIQPDLQHAGHQKTTLERLASRYDTDIDTVRAAMIQIIDFPWAHTTSDIADIEPHRVFEITPLGR